MGKATCENAGALQGNQRSPQDYVTDGDIKAGSWEGMKRDRSWLRWSQITMENRGKGAFPDTEEVRFELSLEASLWLDTQLFFSKDITTSYKHLIKLLITSQSYCISSSVTRGGSDEESEVSWILYLFGFALDLHCLNSAWIAAQLVSEWWSGF